jgi:uncharacterized protein involved in exopolysaccharide biosynthesis
MAVQFNPDVSTEARPSVLPPLLFEPGELRDYIGFAFRAVGRRWRLAVSVLLIFAGSIALAVHYLPSRYHVEAKVLALPAEGAPGVSRQNGETNGLLQSAAEVILSRQNVLELIREHDLVQRWEASRGPILGMVDRVRMLPPDLASRERAMVRILEKKLTVQVKGSLVTIGFDWPDAAAAVDVLRSAEEKLMDARRDAELVPLERKATSLEASVEAARRRVDSLATHIEEAIRSKRRGARAATVRGLQAEGKFRDLPDPELAQKRLQIIAQRKVIAELEDIRRKRLSELNATLAEQRATLGPNNPVLLETREKIRALEADGAQLAGMKTREQELFAEYVRAGGKEIELTAEPAQSWPTELREDDPAIGFEKASLAIEQSTLSRLLDQSEEAQVALLAARASFESRYVEMFPPEAPEAPAFPNLGLLVLAGLLGGAVVAFFGAVAADLSGGVIREAWQARRELEVPLLGEVPQP